MESGRLERRVTAGRMESGRLERRVTAGRMESGRLERRVTAGRMESGRNERRVTAGRMEGGRTDRRVGAGWRNCLHIPAVRGKDAHPRRHFMFRAARGLEVAVCRSVVRVVLVIVNLESLTLPPLLPEVMLACLLAFDDECI